MDGYIEDYVLSFFWDGKFFKGELLNFQGVDEKMSEKNTKGCATVDGNQKSGGNARGEVGSEYPSIYKV